MSPQTATKKGGDSAMPKKKPVKKDAAKETPKRPPKAKAVK